LGNLALLRRLSGWLPFPGAPVHLPLNPDARTYIVALVLALLSGFLFGIVPVRQVFKANPYEIVKARSNNRFGRRITVRDILLVVQIAICAVLVTSSSKGSTDRARRAGIHVTTSPSKYCCARSK
jgi:hypothetical protein